MERRLPFRAGEWEFREGTIRATVLIETILAAFEMDEILFELRGHSAGLNCGRWDYIFSFIKNSEIIRISYCRTVRPVTMDRHFLKSYVDLLIRTCHRRGIHAMGGMAAQIPIKNDPEANEKALEKVRQDKLREVQGWTRWHLGSPSRPGSGRQRGIRCLHEEPNQINRRRDDVSVTAKDSAGRA